MRKRPKKNYYMKGEGFVFRLFHKQNIKRFEAEGYIQITKEEFDGHKTKGFPLFQARQQQPGNKGSGEQSRDDRPPVQRKLRKGKAKRT